MKTSVGDDGYLKITLVKNDGAKTYQRVNRLVATAFVPNPENKPTVNHKDCNVLNNCADNLEWMTVEEQIAYSFSNGQRSHGKLRIHIMTKLHYDKERIHKVCKLLEENQMTQKEIWIATGVRPETIRQIRKHKSYTDISKLYDIDNFNKAVPYPDELRKSIIADMQKGMKNSEIRDKYGLEKSKKTKQFLQYVRKTNMKSEGSTTIKNDGKLVIKINLPD